MKSLLFIFSALLFLSSKVSGSDEESKLNKAPDPLPGPAKPPVYPPKVPVTPPPYTKPVPVTPPPYTKPVPVTPPPYAKPVPVTPPPYTKPALPPIPPAMPPPLPPLAPPTPSLPIIRTKADCIPGCDGRCKLHSRKRLCMRACMTCCDRCKCVPPGTYGNREMCGKCYTDMTTHGDRIKCP